MYKLSGSKPNKFEKIVNGSPKLKKKEFDTVCTYYVAINVC